ncbi:MAG: hypothetical protein ACR2QC_00365 [Gammaproteobacteria bacterium]
MSHSCEGRNLLAERRKLSPKAYNFPPLRGGIDSCLRRNGTSGGGGKFRAFGAEIPAFAGMVYFD